MSHYVLNLEYPRQVKEKALFFQEFVCILPATAADKKLKNVTYLSVTKVLGCFHISIYKLLLHPFCVLIIFVLLPYILSCFCNVSL